MAVTAPAPPTPPAAPPEITQFGALMAEIGKDPKARQQMLEMISAHAPDLHIPELEIRRGVETRLEEHTKPLRETNEQLTKRLASLENAISRDRWAAEHGLSEEEMADFEKFAKDKKLGDPESALDYYQKANLGRPRGTSASATLSDESRKLLHKNPKEWALRRGEEILTEIRRRRGA